MRRCDVLVIGGGVVGQATAFWLLRKAPGLEVVVLERDPTYREASSGLSTGGIRQQFGTRLNIEIARDAVRFYERSREELGTEGEIAFRQHGYLFLARSGQWPMLRERAALARATGVPVEELSPAEIEQAVPGLDAGDLVGGTFCPTDGYLDPASVLAAFRRAAKALGARQETGEATAFERTGTELSRALLADGGEIAADRFVLAAGGLSGRLAAELGASLPVRRLRRQVHVVMPRLPLPGDIPLTIDPSGLHFRPEAGGRLLVAHTTRRDGYDLPLEWDREAFLEELWEPLARRVPSLAELRLEHGWAGYYDENTVDHNAIVGSLPGVGNAYVATGFSGHGLMQSPSVTRGLAELMLEGHYETLDLTPLGPDRFATGRLIVEPAVI
jgi:glycine/D-amino acid oxidase-like deaminating enzyme